jgi:hypothetical protein
MTEAVIVATIAAAPPTLAASLAYLNARATRREMSTSTLVELANEVAVLVQEVQRGGSIVNRIESAVGEPRERVARIEGILNERVPG